MKTGVQRLAVHQWGLFSACVAQSPSSSGLVARSPHSGDVATYLADEAVDALDARFYTAATTDAREQAWAYLEVLRTLAGVSPPTWWPPARNWASVSHATWCPWVPLQDQTLADGVVTDDAGALGAWPSE